MATDVVDVEVAPGHRITGEPLFPREPSDVMSVADLSRRTPRPENWRYSCSCGEIHDVDTDVAQAHVEDVTP